MTDIVPGESPAMSSTPRASAPIPFAPAVRPDSHGFVQPSSYLRARSGSQVKARSRSLSALDVEQAEGLVRDYTFSDCNTLAGTRVNGLFNVQKAIRAFLKVRTSYDVLPMSFRLIIFDTSLLVKKSLDIMIQNGQKSLLK